MKPKEFCYVVLGLMLVLVAGGGYGYYKGLQRLHLQSGQLATKMAEQIEADKQIDSIMALQHQYNRDIVPLMPLIDQALPRNKKQTEILAQIERIASGLGMPPFDAVTMPSPSGLPSDVSQTIKAGVVIALPINFEAKGNPAQLQAFTARLENLNRYTDITLLVIKHDVKADPTKYNFSLNAYIKP
jgi:Tfp pilus assembly protein PilO